MVTINTTASARKEFTDLLVVLMDTISEIGFSDRTLNSAELVETMNALKKLNELTEQMKTTTIYINLEQLRNRGYASRPSLTLEEKIKLPNTLACEQCDRIVSKSHMRRHKTSLLCHQISQSKITTYHKKRTTGDWFLTQQILDNWSMTKRLRVPFGEEHIVSALPWGKIQAGKWAVIVPPVEPPAEDEDDNASTTSSQSYDDHDDNGVWCHYSHTTGGWSAQEPHCTLCGCTDCRCAPPLTIYCDLCLTREVYDADEDEAVTRACSVCVNIIYQRHIQEEQEAGRRSMFSK
tara:strand:+ start:215 stop:1090 length:876 start_codon:yes stop_codon:yes gene_type:complete